MSTEYTKKPKSPPAKKYSDYFKEAVEKKEGRKLTKKEVAEKLAAAQRESWSIPRHQIVKSSSKYVRY